MTLEEFKASLPNDAPPGGVDKALQALWQDAKGNWDKAHQIAQSADDANGDWVHAYLHRREGAISNAKYWYSRVGKKLSKMSIEEEWEQIVEELLATDKD